MGWISEVRRIELPKILISALVLLGTIAPGFLILYLYKPDLIEKLDIAKLLIFSAALTVPVLVTNVLGVLVIFLRAAEEGTDTLAFIVGGTLISIFSFYGSIGAAYEYSLPFGTFLSWLLGVDLVVLLFVALVRLQCDKDERQKSKTPNT